MLPIASFQCCQLVIGIGNWQHFHIDNIVMDDLIPQNMERTAKTTLPPRRAHPAAGTEPGPPQVRNAPEFREPGGRWCGRAALRGGRRAAIHGAGGPPSVAAAGSCPTLHSAFCIPHCALLRPQRGSNPAKRSLRRHSNATHRQNRLSTESTETLETRDRRLAVSVAGNRTARCNRNPAAPPRPCRLCRKSKVEGRPAEAPRASHSNSVLL